MISQSVGIILVVTNRELERQPHSRRTETKSSSSSSQTCFAGLLPWLPEINSRNLGWTFESAVLAGSHPTWAALVSQEPDLRKPWLAWPENFKYCLLPFSFCWLTPLLFLISRKSRSPDSPRLCEKECFLESWTLEQEMAFHPYPVTALVGERSLGSG